MAKYTGKIIKIEQQSPNTRQFWLKVASDNLFDFKAGQFITMDLPIHEKRRLRLRAYSIANTVNTDNILELTITQAGGAGTDYLFEKTKVGTTIDFKGPNGVFTLPKEIKTDLVFICTGTGVAPFRSMILDILHNNKPHQNLHLIFGTRFASGILYQKEFEQLKVDFPEFNYSVALSREENLPNSSFEIQKGYVHNIYKEQYKNKTTNTKFYLCGWQNMVDEAVDILKTDLTCEDGQIIFELYG